MLKFQSNSSEIVDFFKLSFWKKQVVENKWDDVEVFKYLEIVDNPQ